MAQYSSKAVIFFHGIRLWYAEIALKSNHASIIKVILANYHEWLSAALMMEGGWGDLPDLKTHLSS